MLQFNGLLFAFLALIVLQAAVKWLLNRLNVDHLKRWGHKVPEALAKEIDAATLDRMTDYTVESSRLSSLENIADELLTLIILLAGFLPWLQVSVMRLQLPFVFSGLVFFGLLALLTAALALPFGYYRTFVLEKKYGFSTITLPLWLIDLLKGLVIAAILMGILLAALLALIHWAAATWWLWVWALFAAFQLLILWLYPVVIAPLFNKYEPLADQNLKEAIADLLGKSGLQAGEIYQMDAGKRSRHTNAYFTGWGKTKRIVLFDTLLASHTPEEILAVLAHEAGHWKGRHLAKQLLFRTVGSLFTLYLVYRLLSWPLLYRTFGFAEDVPWAGLGLLSLLGGPVFYFLSPCGAALSRRFEKEADDFTCRLTGGRPMRNALIRLAKDNLANLFPHPLYAWFYYSHPPLLERIARLAKNCRTPT